MAFKVHNLQWRYGKDSWAVVTGASDGIGAEYSVILARQGFNLVLISRTESKLEAVKKRALEANSNIRIKVIVADFSGNSNIDFYRALVSKIREIDMSLLILNAGVLYGGLLENAKPKDMQATIDVNVYHPAALLTSLLP